MKIHCVYSYNLFKIDCAFGGIFDDTAENDAGDTKGEKSHWHCVCNNKYTGYTCNKRSCNDLKATTFYGYAYENNKGHLPEACSGEGNCGTSGCLCREGFTGAKCNKCILLLLFFNSSSS